MDINTIQIKLPTDLINKINIHCAETGESASNLIQNALNAYFADMVDLEINFSQEIDPLFREIVWNEIRSKVITID